MEEHLSSTQLTQWPIKDLWEKYEEITMHFNNLLMRLRTQSLAGVAVISTAVGLFARSNDIHLTGGIVAVIFVGLSLFWVAIWILDFFYYNPLLIGAATALVALEEKSKTQSHISHIDLSTSIREATSSSIFTRCSTVPLGVWLFYIIVFVALLGGFFLSMMVFNDLLSF
ncbi:MAG: hypothetical protein V4437_02680 [Patescibacteria group bacterium]